MKFACVDGADFDGHLVNFDELALRQKRFEREEKSSLERYRNESANMAQWGRPGYPPPSWVGLPSSVPPLCELPVPLPATPESRLPKNIKTIPPERAPMPHQKPEERAHNFKEVALGLDLEGALHEAERCIRCKKPRCVPGCPVGIDIPGFIAALAQKDIERSYRILKNTNALPAVCGRVCPQETQCEATCVVGAKFQPVAVGRLERFVADCARGRGWDEAKPGPGAGSQGPGEGALAGARGFFYL